MTFVPLLLRLLLCIALVAGLRAPALATVAVEPPAAVQVGAMPCHADAAKAMRADTSNDAGGTHGCCDAAQACECVAPGVAIPAPAMLALRPSAPAPPTRPMHAPREAPPPVLPIRPPIATA